MNNLKFPWTTQPQQAVGIDWGNPIARGLAFAAFPIDGTLADAVGNALGTKSGSASISNGPRGRQITCSPATSDYFDVVYRGRSSDITGPITLLWSGKINTGSRYHDLISKSSASAGVNLPFEFRTTNDASPKLFFARADASFSRSATSSITVPLNTYKTLVATCSTGSGATSAFGIYSDGIKDTSVTLAGSSSSPYTDNANNIRMGRRTDGVTNLDGVALCGYVWNRALSDSEIRSISQNPWQIFKPIPRRIFVPLDVGSGLTQVYQSLDATYGMAGSVTSDRAAAYNVRTTATTDLSANYTARVAAVADLSSSYTARTSTTTDLSASYGVAGNVQQSLSSTYNVRESATADTSADYSVRGAVSTDLVPSYAVRSAVTTDLAPSYSLRSAVTQDVSSVYQIVSAGSVSASFTSSYNVRTTATADIAPGYAVRESVSSDINVGFDIALAVVQSVSADYKVRAAAVQSLPATYNILAISQVTSSLTVNYLVASELIVRDSASLVSELHLTALLTSHTHPQANIVSPTKQKVNISSKLM